MTIRDLWPIGAAILLAGVVVGAILAVFPA